MASFEEIAAESQQRWEELTAGGQPWIRVGTALCGKASGCDAVIASIEAALEQNGVAAQLSQVGCLGLCFAEPLVDVQLPGGPRVFYGNVTPDMAAEIVSNHVAGGSPLAHLALGYPAAGGPDEEVDSTLAGIPDLNQHPMRVLENRVALRNAGTIDPGDIHQYIAYGGYHALNRALTEMTPEEVLEDVKTSGLRGLSFIHI